MALQPKRGRPSLSDLILDAVAVGTARKGASLALIKKTLATKGYDVERNKGRLKAALGSLLDKGLLRRVTGSGFSGSFRVGRVGKRRAAEGAGRAAAAGGKAKGPGRAVKQRRKAGKAKGKEAAVEEEGKATGDAQETRGPVEAAAPERAS